jgi:hypothetical protein
VKYAEKQLVRPQHENGCDYGHGRRSVLVQNGKQQILHVAGSKHWGGIGAGRHYSPSHIAAYPDERGTCKQRTLAEGRMTMQKWAEIADAIRAHLGVEFSLELISLTHTLLLDEPGEVAGPPPATQVHKKKVHPRIESDTLYRYTFRDNSKFELLKFPITKQVNGVTVYKLENGREVDRRTKHLIDEGCAGTVEGAKEAYLKYYKEQREEALERLKRAADHYAYANDNLTEAKQRIEALDKEQTDG